MPSASDSHLAGMRGRVLDTLARIVSRKENLRERRWRLIAELAQQPRGSATDAGRSSKVVTRARDITPGDSAG